MRKLNECTSEELVRCKDVCASYMESSIELLKLYGFDRLELAQAAIPYLIAVTTIPTAFKPDQVKDANVVLKLIGSFNTVKRLEDMIDGILVDRTVSKVKGEVMGND